MNKTLLVPLVLASLAPGCTASDEPIEVSRAALTEVGDTGPALTASVDWDGWMIYGASRTLDGAPRYHHVEIIDYHGGDGPDLEVGQVYLDGPAVNDRGTVDDYLTDEGILAGDFPVPWIDAMSCDGASHDTIANCRMAVATEVKLSDAGDAVRFDYRMWMPGDVEPSVSGTFTAEHGKIGQIPGQ